MGSLFNGDHRRGSTSEQLQPSPTFDHTVTFQYQIQQHGSRMQRLSKAIKVYRLAVLTLICVGVGIGVGLLSRPYARHWTEREFMYIEIPGELYLRFLKLMIIPLLVSNVILAFGSIQTKLTSHLGKLATGFYLSSNIIAISVAIMLTLAIKPGQPSSLKQSRGQVPPTNNHNKLYPPNSNMYGQQSLKEYHDSIKRYREYHPMFYHSPSDTMAPDRGHKSDAINLGDSMLQNAEVIEVDLIAQLSDTATNEPPVGRAKAIDQHQVTPPSPTISNNTNTHHNNFNKKLPVDVLLDLLRNLVPDSLVGASMIQTQTRLYPPDGVILYKDGTTNPPVSEWSMGHEPIGRANIVGLLAISVMTGVMLSYMDEASRPLLDLCACVSELSLRVNMFAINLTPFCIMSLLIGQVARSCDLRAVASELLMYCVTVIIALVVHGFILLPLAYYLCTKKSPLTFFRGMLEALAAAFATSSSSATMGLMLNGLNNLQLNPLIVRAFGPLGSVFNMNGTAIYGSIATIFIAQTLGITLSTTSLVLVGLASAVASLSTTGIPSSGMMTIVIVLNTVNLPVLQLSLIYIVDFIIDRFRTVINIWSASIICGLLDNKFPENMFPDEEMKPEKYLEMMKYRASRATLSGRKSLTVDELNQKPQVISVTITPPTESSQM